MWHNPRVETDPAFGRAAHPQPRWAVRAMRQVHGTILNPVVNARDTEN